MRIQAEELTATVTAIFTDGQRPRRGRSGRDLLVQANSRDTMATVSDW